MAGASDGRCRTGSRAAGVAGRPRPRPRRPPVPEGGRPPGHSFGGRSRGSGRRRKRGGSADGRMTVRARRPERPEAPGAGGGPGREAWTSGAASRRRSARCYPASVVPASTGRPERVRARVCRRLLPGGAEEGRLRPFSLLFGDHPPEAGDRECSCPTRPARRFPEARWTIAARKTPTGSATATSAPTACRRRGWPPGRPRGFFPPQLHDSRWAADPDRRPQDPDGFCLRDLGTHGGPAPSLSPRGRRPGPPEVAASCFPCSLRSLPAWAARVPTATPRSGSGKFSPRTGRRGLAGSRSHCSLRVFSPRTGGGLRERGADGVGHEVLSPRGRRPPGVGRPGKSSPRARVCGRGRHRQSSGTRVLSPRPCVRRRLPCLESGFDPSSSLPALPHPWPCSTPLRRNGRQGPHSPARGSRRFGTSG